MNKPQPALGARTIAEHEAEEALARAELQAEDAKRIKALARALLKLRRERLALERATQGERDE